MNGRDVCCTRCSMPLPVDRLNEMRPAPCPSCGTKILAVAFPALLAAPTRGRSGRRRLSDEEAACFYHPAKQAATPCDHCGRFLCELCDIQVGDRHLCPSCIRPDANQAKIAPLENRRVVYDHLALVLAILPMAVTPLIALYLAARYWSREMSVLPRSRVRWVLAVLFAVVQIGLWSWLLLRD